MTDEQLEQMGRNDAGLGKPMNPAYASELAYQYGYRRGAFIPEYRVIPEVVRVGKKAISIE